MSLSCPISRGKHVMPEVAASPGELEAEWTIGGIIAPDGTPDLSTLSTDSRHSMDLFCEARCVDLPAASNPAARRQVLDAEWIKWRALGYRWDFITLKWSHKALRA